MLENNNLYDIAESVSEGHPDKICDLIADKILDACLQEDPNSRVACEVFATKEYILLGGEITSLANVDYEQIVRKTLYEIGYLKPELGIGYKTCKIQILIKKQSSELEKVVQKNINFGDQGISLGYATNENNYYMPSAILLANEIMKLASDLRKKGIFKYARPDMKTQVIICNKKIKSIFISVQHDPDVDKKYFEKFIYQEIFLKVARKHNFNTDFTFYINPSGSFVNGGPDADTGLTGRKLVCDTYGPICPHGGGAFSGKDGTKPDRSLAYYARYIAKNLVAANIAEKIEVKIAYMISRTKPIKIIIETFKAKYKKDVIDDIVEKVFDASAQNVIQSFALNKQFFPEKLGFRHFRYCDISVYGHFGRLDIELPWEKLDKVEEIKKIIKSKNK